VRRECRGHGVTVEHVELRGRELARSARVARARATCAAGSQGGDGGCDLVLGAAERHNLGAALDEQLGRGEADAGGAAEHEGALAEVGESCACHTAVR